MSTNQYFDNNFRGPAQLLPLHRDHAPDLLHRQRHRREARPRAAQRAEDLFALRRLRLVACWRYGTRWQSAPRTCLCAASPSPLHLHVHAHATKHLNASAQSASASVRGPEGHRAERVEMFVLAQRIGCINTALATDRAVIICPYLFTVRTASPRGEAARRGRARRSAEEGPRRSRGWVGGWVGSSCEIVHTMNA